MKVTHGVVGAYTDSLSGNKGYQWMDTETMAPIEQPSIAFADHPFVMDVIKRLSGKMLTLVESTVSDKEQRKATKDLVKGFFSEEMNHIGDLMYSSKYMDMMCAEAEKSSPEGLVSIDVEDIIRG